MRPFGGTRLYSFRRCWVEVMAARTESLLTRDLMFEAVPYSVANMFVACEICERGGLQMEVRCKCRSAMPVVDSSGVSAQDERDHACSSSTGSFETLDQPLDLPYLDAASAPSPPQVSGSAPFQKVGKSSRLVRRLLRVGRHTDGSECTQVDEDACKFGRKRGLGAGPGGMTSKFRGARQSSGQVQIPVCKSIEHDNIMLVQRSALGWTLCQQSCPALPCA